MDIDSHSTCEERTLAGAIATHQCDDLTAMNREIEFLNYLLAIVIHR